MNGLNGFDYVAIALFAIGAIYGLQRGALRMVTSVVALAAAIYFASIYYNKAGAFAETQLGSSHTVGAVIGYVAVFALIFAAVEIIGSFAIRLMQVVHLSPLDRLAGGLLGAGVAAVFAGLVVMLMAAVLPPDAALLRNSQLVPMLLAYNEMLVGYIPGDAKLAYERNRDDLMRYWVQNAMKDANPRAVAGCVALALHEVIATNRGWDHKRNCFRALDSARLRDSAVDCLHQPALGHRADDLFLDLAALDDEQVGNAAHAVTSGSLRIVVNVDLRNLQAPVVLARKIVEDRRDRAAWPAPRRPEINQHRSRRLQNFLVEARVGNMNDFVAGHRNFLLCDQPQLKISTAGHPVKADYFLRIVTAVP